MRQWLTLVLSAGLLIAAPATAQPAADSPIPRTYPEGSTQRADPAKPGDQYAREQTNADASEADCNVGKWAACTSLGHAYERGAGRPQNRPVAELLYRKACNAAESEGCFRLGNLLDTTDRESDQALAFQLFIQACDLGSLMGCDAEADALALGSLGEPDPQAAEALRRATCQRGGGNACRTLAGMLIASERSPAEQEEGRGLLDRQCRARNAQACEDAAEHWRELIAPGAEEQMVQYQRLGCDARDGRLCLDLSLAETKKAQQGAGPQARAAAVAFFERACSLEPFVICHDKGNLRDAPVLTARCDGGEQAACAALGAILAARQSPLEDRPRALVLLSQACEAGETTACPSAADLVLENVRSTGVPQPERLEAYLVRGCDAGLQPACETLADELVAGDHLPQDADRAAALYIPLCQAGIPSACEAAEKIASDEPAAPLMQASAVFAPDLTPEEEAEEAELAYQRAARERAERRAQNCTTTTVVFEGVSYSDTLCEKLAYVIGRGFSVRRGATPWQALIWRPALLNGVPLKPAERVWCGGSVIREGWVLTAAHCLVDKDISSKSIKTAGHTIRLGLTNALGDEGFTYPIIETYRHPDYSGLPTLAFDIALVRYDPKRGMRGNSALPPALIRLDPLPLGKRLVEAIPRASVYGWGLTAFRGGVIPDGLRGARVKLRDLDTCTDITKFKDTWRDSVLCADELKGDEGGQACSGDSGGPLITYSDPDRVPTLIGVVSAGVDCGTKKLPSRYIRVAHPLVQKWLSEVLPPPGRR